jgi:hypothetical protein
MMCVLVTDRTKGAVAVFASCPPLAASSAVDLAVLVQDAKWTLFVSPTFVEK